MRRVMENHEGTKMAKNTNELFVGFAIFVVFVVSIEQEHACSAAS